MFDGCYSLNLLPDISRWNTHNVRNMSCLFKDCQSLINIPNITIWNIDKVDYLSHMFSGCLSLVSLSNIVKKINRYYSIDTFLIFNDCFSCIDIRVIKP